MIKKIFFLFLLFSSSYTNAQILKYERFISEFTDINDSTKFIILRKFKSSDKNIKYLALNLMTLETKIISSNNLVQRDWKYLEDKYSSSIYMKLRNYAKTHKNKRGLKNAGIQNIKSNHNYMITTDLCPSSKKLDYHIYTHIANNIKETIPIGIAITGSWMRNHKDELKWLLNLEKNKTLSITWINHSYNHHYIIGRELNSNFLLIRDTDIEKEVLYMEKFMLENKLNISVYFRFPGLISNTRIYNQIIDYGLIPLGADSWIGKNKFPKEGSIVLVHGNGNDPKGVKKLKKWLDRNANNLTIKSINRLIIDYYKAKLESSTY